MLMKRKLLLFSVIFFVYYALINLAWGAIERPRSIQILWKVLAIPLIQIVVRLTKIESPAAALAFYVAIVANGLLWAAVLTFVITRLSPNRFRK